MAVQGTVQLGPTGDPLEITAFQVMVVGLDLGPVAAGGTSEPTGPTVPTTGQLWPRGAGQG